MQRTRGPGGKGPGVRTQPARPAAARRSGSGAGGGPGGGSARRTPAPRPRRRTGRTTVLATVLIALLLAYAYPVRVYLSQQAEIQALEDKQYAQRLHIRELEDERAKWNDDEYVRAQARRRLHYVLPGETAYLVLDANPAPDAPGGGGNAGSRKQPQPWYGGLWSSIGVANR